MTDAFEIMIRTFVAFLALWLFISILGKQSIAQRTNHGFIASIILGTIAGNMAFNIKIHYSLFMLSLLILSTIAYGLTLLALRNQRSRKWIVGQPTVLIENGKILEDNMRKLKFTLDTLNQSLREKGVFDIKEVEHAVLEINGSLSVLKKPGFRPVTKGDISLPSERVKFPVELIMDGEIMDQNLTGNQLSYSWLAKELRKRGLQQEDVFYAVRSTDGRLYFDLYEDRIRSPIDKE